VAEKPVNPIQSIETLEEIYADKDLPPVVGHLLRAVHTLRGVKMEIEGDSVSFTVPGFEYPAVIKHEKVKTIRWALSPQQNPAVQIEMGGEQYLMFTSTDLRFPVDNYSKIPLVNLIPECGVFEMVNSVRAFLRAIPGIRSSEELTRQYQTQRAIVVSAEQVGIRVAPLLRILDQSVSGTSAEDLELRSSPNKEGVEMTTEFMREPMWEAKKSELLYFARRFIKSGAYADAAEICETALKKYPKDFEFSKIRARALTELRQFENAVRSYQDALATNPTHFSTTISFFKCCVEAGKNAFVVAHINKFLKNYSDSDRDQLLNYVEKALEAGLFSRIELSDPVAVELGKYRLVKKNKKAA